MAVGKAAKKEICIYILTEREEFVNDIPEFRPDKGL